jgi:hypothetical protein
VLGGELLYPGRSTQQTFFICVFIGSAGWLAVWLAGWAWLLAASLPLAWLVAGWLRWTLAGWLVGWLAGWLAGLGCWLALWLWPGLWRAGWAGLDCLACRLVSLLRCFQISIVLERLQLRNLSLCIRLFAELFFLFIFAIMHPSIHGTMNA